MRYLFLCKLCLSSTEVVFVVRPSRLVILSSVSVRQLGSEEQLVNRLVGL